MHSLQKLALSAALPAALLSLWEISARAGWLPPSLSASPSAVAINIVRLLWSGPLLSHLGYSLLRILTAVTIAAAVGVLSGICLTQSQRLDTLVSPTLQFLAPVPVVAWMPFVILFFGAGEAYKIILAALAGFLIIHLHTYQAIRAIGREYIELSQMYECDIVERVRHVLLPAALPGIFVGLRLTLAIAWIVIFFVEFGSATQGSEGLGWFIADSRALGRVEDEYAGVVVLGVVGYLTDRLMAKLQAHSLRWSDTARGAEVSPWGT